MTPDEYRLPPLPPPRERIETLAVLRRAAAAHRCLAELKSIADTIPNQGVLLNALTLQEAKDSSAIENIVTTHDELFRTELFPELDTVPPAAKEVRRYVAALMLGWQAVASTQMLKVNHIIAIQQELEDNTAGVRRLPGTDLRNEITGETVYTPPQHHDDIVLLLNNLELFINDDTTMPDLDPLIRMAVIHWQFESIHPFYDGNGRTGRIINILYLVLKDLLRLPTLYLSRYIIGHKADYYALLQNVRTQGDWESWVLYILRGVEETAQQTVTTVRAIRAAMDRYDEMCRDTHGYHFYSANLINHLFSQTYTKIELVQNALHVNRATAATYLNRLAQDGLLSKHKVGRANYFVNPAMLAIFAPELLSSEKTDT